MILICDVPFVYQKQCSYLKLQTFNRPWPHYNTWDDLSDAEIEVRILEPKENDVFLLNSFSLFVFISRKYIKSIKIRDIWLRYIILSFVSKH